MTKTIQHIKVSYMNGNINESKDHLNMIVKINNKLMKVILNDNVENLIKISRTKARNSLN